MYVDESTDNKVCKLFAVANETVTRALQQFLSKYKIETLESRARQISVHRKWKVLLKNSLCVFSIIIS